MGDVMEDQKKRIYEIAKEEGLPSSLVLQRLQRAGRAREDRVVHR